MNENTLSLKEIRLAIPCQPKVAKTLLNNGKDYDALLIELLNYDSYSDEDQIFPSNKELQATLHLTPGKLRTQLMRLYNDFLESMSGPETALDLGPILVDFYIRDYLNRNSVTISAKLQVIPNRGDNLEFPFLRPIFSISTCYVQEIYHRIENDRQTIAVWAKIGFYNAYEDFEFHKAKSEGRYDWKTDSITEVERPSKYTKEPERKFWGRRW